MQITLISGIIFIIDQLIKLLVTANMNLHEEINIIENFFSLFYVRNFGAGFSILFGQRLFLILVNVGVILGIIYYLCRNKEIKKYEIYIYSILIGGILGNLFDRVFHGYVIDYLAFNIFGWDYPVFNFADMAIVLSIFAIIFLGIKDDINENKSRRNRKEN